MISIVIPFYNEEENLLPLYEELIRVMSELKREFEIIFVNDGSTDNGRETVENLISKNAHVKLVDLGKRMGKGEALSAGIKNSKGEIVVLMDSDLQDDPKDIQRFLDKIDNGFDFVNGKRIGRQHNIILKTYSLLGNLFVRLLSGSPYSDVNCGFKAFKKTVLKDIVLYGNNFRFLPLGVYYEGYKIGEVEVNNRPRRHGKSKFGIGKVLIGFLDTIAATFIYRFSERPLHFFGSIGAVVLVPGLIIAAILTYERIFFGVLLYRRPALLYAILLIIVGLQIVMTGILGELIVYLNKKKT